MESKDDRGRRIRRNVVLIATIMSIIAAIFIVGIAISYPDGLFLALVMGAMAVSGPIFGYLYSARLWGILDE